MLSDAYPVGLFYIHDDDSPFAIPSGTVVALDRSGGVQVGGRMWRHVPYVDYIHARDTLVRVFEGERDDDEWEHGDYRDRLHRLEQVETWTDPTDPDRWIDLLKLSQRFFIVHSCAGDWDSDELSVLYAPDGDYRPPWQARLAAFQQALAEAVPFPDDEEEPDDNED